MKGFYKTLALAGVVALLVAYVVWDFTANLEKGEGQPGEVALTEEISRNSLSEVHIQKSGEVLQLSFSDGKCHLKAPVEDLCDSVSAENLLNHLSDLRGIPLPSDGLNLEEMGLNDAEGTEILVRFKDGKELKLKVGAKNTFDGRFYVQVDQKIYISGQNTVQLTNKGIRQLRDHKVWRAGTPVKDVTEVQVRLDFEGSRENYTLVKLKDVWILKSPEDSREVNSEKVQAWLNSIGDLRASEILKPGTNEVKNPTLEANFVFEGGTYRLYFSKSPEPDMVLITDPATQREMKVSASSVTQIQVPYSYFFDGRKSFQFSLEQASDLFITKDGKTDHFQKEDSGWNYKGKKENFNESKLPDFFNKLRQLEAKTYFKPQKWYGLEDRDQKRIRVLDKEGKSLLDMTWGGRFKPSQGPFKGLDMRYVQVFGQKFSFGVSNVRIEELLNLNLFENKAEAKESNHGDVH